MSPLSELVQMRFDGFLEDLFRATSGPSPIMSSPVAKAEVLRTIDIALHRHMNKYTAFSHLPTDVVHFIFGMVLDLDRIHDFDLPLDDLERHCKNLFRMRCVSSDWNVFLLSTPRYWCTIDLAAPEDMVKAILARAKQTPLCLFSKRRYIPGSKLLPGRGCPALLECTTPVRTIRSDDQDTYDFWTRLQLLRETMPDLRTLELTKTAGWEGMGEVLLPEYFGVGLPRIQHLSATGWQPNPGAAWLQNLQTLTLKPPLELNVNMLRVLSACSRVTKLTIHADSGPVSEEELVGAPSVVELPYLQELDIEVDLSLDVGYIVPRLAIPDDTRCFLRIIHIGAQFFVPDICQFLYSGAHESEPPQEALLEIGHRRTLRSVVWYVVGKRTVDLVPEQQMEGVAGDEFFGVLKAIQARIKDLPLTLRVWDLDYWTRRILERLHDLKATRIWLKCTRSEVIPEMLEVLGGYNRELPDNCADDEQWPFESLRELTIEGATFDADRLIKIFQIRQAYLRKFSKKWIEKVTLIGCSFYDTDVEMAAAELATMRVTLVDFV